MRHLLWLFSLCAVAAVLAASSGYTQDTKKDDVTVMKGTLPPGWSKIGLSADQKKKITTIRGTYAGKIDNLKKQIDLLKEEDMAECLKILTDEQKTQLKKILSDKIDGKDWFRWGMKILHDRQKDDGSWNFGPQYHGFGTLADTCFALLFLQQANLFSEEIAEEIKRLDFGAPAARPMGTKE